jgi:hypothetical protein
MKHKWGLAVALAAFTAVLSCPVAAQDNGSGIRSAEAAPVGRIGVKTAIYSDDHWSDIVSLALARALANPATAGSVGSNSLGRLDVKVRMVPDDHWGDILSVALANALENVPSDGSVARIIHVPQDQSSQ